MMIKYYHIFIIQYLIEKKELIKLHIMQI